MTTPVPERSQVLGLARKVAEDRDLPDRLRTYATRAAAQVEEPARLLLRLQQEAKAYLPLQPRQACRISLCKVVTADSFLRHYALPEYRDSFETAEGFSRFVATSSDPELTLREALAPKPVLLVWYRSWLTPERDLHGKTGNRLIQELEITGQPPVIVLHFGREALIASGVSVRTPCSLDAVLGQNYQWRPGGPRSGLREYIDGDVPSAALTSLEWRE